MFWLVVIEYEVRVPAENTSMECIGKYIRRTESLFSTALLSHQEMGS